MATLATPLLLVLSILLFPLVLVGSIMMDLFEADTEQREARP